MPRSPLKGSLPKPSVTIPEANSVAFLASPSCQKLFSLCILSKGPENAIHISAKWKDPGQGSMLIANSGKDWWNRYWFFHMEWIIAACGRTKYLTDLAWILQTQQVATKALALFRGLLLNGCSHEGKRSSGCCPETSTPAEAYLSRGLPGAHLCPAIVLLANRWRRCFEFSYNGRSKTATEMRKNFEEFTWKQSVLVNQQAL